MWPLGLVGIQWPEAWQAAESGEVATPGEVDQHRFGPVTGGMAGDGIAAQVAAMAQQRVVAPVARCGFGVGLAINSTVDDQGVTLVLAPSRQFGGDRSGAPMPAMVSMPKMKSPLVKMTQIHQQLQQSHGVLSAGDRHQQTGLGWQQCGLIQQMPMDAVMPATPTSVRHGCHPSDGRLE